MSIKTILAPMAGVTNKAYRYIAKKYGADYLVSEMVSAKALTYGDKKSLELAEITAFERPVSIQLFGSDPQDFYKAIVLLTEKGIVPDCYDINAGCPMPKITKGGAGSALAKTPLLFGQIVSACVKAGNRIPVTAKFRSDNALVLAKIARECGAEAVTVHGRGAAQLYSGKSDNDIIREVKAAVNIKVIGNGDIVSYETANDMVEYTKCDAVMIGRGSLGRPWLFREIMNGAEYEPDFSGKIDVMREHVRLLAEFSASEIAAMKQARGVAAHYIRGIRGAAEFRRRCTEMTTLKDFEVLAEEIVTYTVSV